MKRTHAPTQPTRAAVEMVGSLSLQKNRSSLMFFSFSPWKTHHKETLHFRLQRRSGTMALDNYYSFHFRSATNELFIRGDFSMRGRTARNDRSAVLLCSPIKEKKYGHDFRLLCHKLCLLDLSPSPSVAGERSFCFGCPIFCPYILIALSQCRSDGS